MASTYSTNLAIELIGTGDQAGAWGNTTNTNLGTLIEQAISGYVTQAVSTGTDTTITIPNGATGVARNMYIELTGTGGTNTNLIVPANKKLYFIFNNASGAVTVKVSGQTGVSVPAGKKVVLASNGTDAVNALNYIAEFGSNSATITQLTATSATITNLTLTSLVISNLSIASANITTLTSSSATISTTLALSGGTANGVLYLNGSKVATSGSALVFDGTNLGIGTSSPSSFSSLANEFVVNGSTSVGITISESTGAGTSNLLFAATSSFPNRGNISYDHTASALTFGINATEAMRLTSTTLYTASGINVGIGTSSPTTPLDVTKAGGGNFVANFQNTTSATPYGVSIKDAATPTAGYPLLQISNSAGSSVYFRVDSSTGNVGIGTSSPTVRLDVAGSGNVTSRARFEKTGTGKILQFGADRDTSALPYIGSESNHGFSIITNNTEVAQFSAAGNLGIGTSSPNKKLDVDGGSIQVRTGGKVIADTLENYGTTLTLNAGGSLPIVFSLNGSQAMRLESGNLGLGVTPGTWNTGYRAFQFGATGALYSAVSGTDFVSLDYNVIVDASNSVYKQTDVATRYRQISGQHQWFNAPSGTAGNTISFTQAMTLDASGNLGVGTTSPNIGGVNKAITVNSATSTNCSYELSVNNVLQGSLFTGISTSSVALYTVANGPLLFGTNNTERARITASGELLIGTVTSGADARLVVENPDNVSGDYCVVTRLGSNCDNTSSYHLIVATGGSDKLYIYGNGNVVNVNNSYGTLSDVKLKTDIVDASSQWDDVKAIKFRKFKLKGDESGITHLGVVAQELEQTSPGLVEEHADRDTEGNDLGTTTKSVKSSILLMKAAVALQEAMARIEKLEAEMALLKGA